MGSLDANRWRRATQAIGRRWSQSTLRHSLTKLIDATCARANWLALALLVTVGIVSYWNTTNLIASNRGQNQLRTLLSDLQGLLTSVNEAETGQRGFLLTGDESYLKPYLAAMTAADRQFNHVKLSMGAIPGQRGKVDALQRSVATKFVEMKETIRLRQTEGDSAALLLVRTDRGQQQMETIRGGVGDLTQVIQSRLAEIDLRNVTYSTWTTRWSMVGNVLAAVLFLSVIQREYRERARVEAQARTLAESVERSRIEAIAISDGEIETLGQQARVLADFVQTLQEQTHTESDKEIATLVQQARELASSVETSRLQTLFLSDEKVKALGKQARDLARSVETSRVRTLNQTDGRIEALGEQARQLAGVVESARIQTLSLSDGRIRELGQRARDLATVVESSRIETLNLSDGKIEELGQQARDLATFVESARLETLTLSDGRIEEMGQQARELATVMESARIETLSQSDGRIEELGQQARELATVVESARIETLSQSDGRIEELSQQARDLATVVESERIETLNQSNREIRKLNEDLEQRVLERTSQLEAANKELDSFSYSVSHDLRAPLRAIDGFSRIVLEDYGTPLAAEGKAYLQMVRDNTRQMGQLVDDLLAFARLGRQPLAKQTVDPDTIVRRCLEELTKETQGRQVEIVIGELPECEADSALLKQVWTNLLANALKYTRKQEVARIEIGCRRQPRAPGDGQPAFSENGDGQAVYYVKDNGAGFDMKYSNKLFGVFQRLHRATDYEGTGVGLAIVQRIVQRHGGRIWAEAKLNEGATFSFTLC